MNNKIVLYIILLIIIIYTCNNNTNNINDNIPLNQKIKKLKFNDLENKFKEDVKYIENKIVKLNNKKNQYIKDKNISKTKLLRKLETMDIIIDNYRLDMKNIENEFNNNIHNL